MHADSHSGAALRLHLSQPSVSRITADLEREFGCPLFIRKGKGVQPTPEAEEFLIEVERSYLALTSLEDAAQEIAHKERGSLTFGANTALSLEVVPRALRALGVRDQNISINWHVKTSRWVTEFAGIGTLKLGYANIQDLPEGVNLLYEGAVPHMCILPNGHALTGQTQIVLDDLKHEQLIGLQGSVADELAARKIGKKCQAPLTTELSLTALLLAEDDTGLPIVDAFTAHFWVGMRNCVALPVSDLPIYRFALFEPIGSRRSLIAVQFKDKLVAETERVLHWVEEKSGPRGT
ncbi:LysR family transcriptional regulator (plasmid) [Phaeobacter inhibens]|uniref:LysR family transcriptional regulator n=1 Tax=Phaeobacter inhibens TaxID=221822 RepID=UPI0001632AA5|nr:LysR family transcriptional regulator [Phaeobacter inhibens]AFO93448.1 putative transcriptional regulator, LysR family [Phaeobacter inhibens DSM 17395]AUQ48148.1 putative transcriptional regulator, LysR family [Phaeobacter inhibens]AXT24940.1 LysR family transcriptional regulator [Phaeobacter inhibens]